MKMESRELFFVFLIILQTKICLQDVIYFGDCEKDQKGVFSVSTSFGKFPNGSEFVNCVLDVREPITNDLKSVLEFETSGDNEKYRKLFVLREKKYCSALSKNLGEFWHGIEQAAKIPVGECPVKKGHYKANKYPFSMDSIVILKTLPKGYLKLTTHIYPLNGKKEVACIRAILRLN